MPVGTMYRHADAYLHKMPSTQDRGAQVETLQFIHYPASELIGALLGHVTRGTTSSLRPSAPGK
jgi:hypothetical protein